MMQLKSHTLATAAFLLLAPGALAGIDSGKTGPLTIHHEVEAFREKLVDHEWTITHAGNLGNLNLKGGEAARLPIQLTATRSETPKVEFNQGAQGKYCLTNNSSFDLESARIRVQLHEAEKGAWTAIPGAEKNLELEKPLEPGETRCVEYRIGAELESHETYLAQITTDYLWEETKGSEGQVVTSETFTADCETQVTERDLRASAIAQFSCMEGLECVAKGETKWDFSETQTVSYELEVRNVSACGTESVSLEHVATLVEEDHETVRRDSRDVKMELPMCAQPPKPENCVMTPAQWMTNLNLAEKLLPEHLGTAIGPKRINIFTRQDIVDVLGMQTYGTPKNPVTRLYAEFLAAQLNVKNGASPSHIWFDAILADIALSNDNWKDWDSFNGTEKAAIHYWLDRFERYNRGELCPKACNL